VIRNQTEFLDHLLHTPVVRGEGEMTTGLLNEPGNLWRRILRTSDTQAQSKATASKAMEVIAGRKSFNIGDSPGKALQF
jgi:hypothetical protein